MSWVPSECSEESNLVENGRALDICICSFCLVSYFFGSPMPLRHILALQSRVYLSERESAREREREREREIERETERDRERHQGTRREIESERARESDTRRERESQTPRA